MKKLKKEQVKEAIARVDKRHFHRLAAEFESYINDYMTDAHPDASPEEIEQLVNLNPWYAHLMDFLYGHENIETK